MIIMSRYGSLVHRCRCARWWTQIASKALSALAVLLTATGLYGLLSYYVAQRRQEIGIRMALGASTRDVLRLVLGNGFVLVVIGVAIGVAGSFAAVRLLASFVFGIGVTDPLAFCAAILGIAAVALLASYLPAKRASKVDPMIALRYE